MAVHGIDYRLQFRQIPAHLLMLATDLTIIDVSDTFLDNTGTVRDQIVGRHVFDVFPAPDEQRKQMECAFLAAAGGERTAIEEMLYAIPDASAPDGMREAWWSNVNMPIFAGDGRVSHVVQVGQDVTALVKEQQLKSAIQSELQHRIGNLLTLVLAVAKRTADNETDLDGFLVRFSERLQALARTQSYLVGDNWRGASLHVLVRHHLGAYVDGSDDRLLLDGPPLWVQAEHAQSISMALHELATNCAKYGAFSGPDGRVHISWSGTPREDFAFSWTEEHPLPAGTPPREGFGSMILTRIFPGQMGGVGERRFLPTGFRYTLTPARGIDAPAPGRHEDSARA